MSKIKKSLLALALLIGLSGSVFASADTVWVNRSGKFLKTTSPTVGNLTVEGSLVSEAEFVTSGDISITKDKPLLTLTSATDSSATIVLNSGDTKSGFFIIKQDGSARWTFGNNANDANSFILSSGDALGVNNALEVTTSGVTVPGTLTSTGILTASSTMNVVQGARLGSTLQVSGNATIIGTLTVSDNVTVSGNLSVERAILHRVVTLADGATDIDASLGDIFVTQANTGATEIASISNAAAGQVITLIGGSATNATTVADSGNFKLTGTFTAETNDSLTLTIVDASTFVECARSDN